MNPAKILDFIKTAPTPLTKRELAREFGLKGSGPRVALKKILKQLEDDGAIVKQAGGKYTIPDGLPGVTIIEVSDIDIDGDVFATPVDWNPDVQGPPPRIEIMPDNKGHPALSVQDRVLARLARVDKDTYEAKTIKRLDTEAGRVLGMIRVHKNGAILEPADKKAKFDFEVPSGDTNGAKDGDLVIGELQPGRGLKLKKARVIEVLGQKNDPKIISLLSLHEAGLREEFPDAVMKAAQGLKVPDPKGREDLRGYPLVTIDGADARDFDDAVYAAKEKDGYHLIVAIADVAHYVKPGSALDIEAQARGNSTYFPDRVVPMLPEALSNDLCSLRPKENRACLAAHMWIDFEGNLQRFKFVRGLMKSAARLTYEQVQAAYDGNIDDITAPLVGSVINPLYKAYNILDQARQRRGALDLDLPERQIVIDDKGQMTGVRKRERLDAHKLIEEFMVLANVAAAKALEAKQDPKSYPCVYRIHDAPSADKLQAAGEFVQSFDLSLPKGQNISPGQLNSVLRQASKLEYGHLVSQVILRCQSQAHYATDNIGHYGLALKRYAHFTSPIRRYADLLVHRSLINAYRLGGGGMSEEELARLDEICGHISTTERTSMVAERNSVDRFTAAYLSEKVGSEFAGRITGVTRFGLFVELDESGADGLVPMRSLPDDYYIHDETSHALIGRRRGHVFRMGARVTAKLMEAEGLTGSTVLNLVGHDNGADIPGFKPPKTSYRGKSNPKKPYKKKGNKNSRKKPKGKRKA